MAIFSLNHTFIGRSTDPKGSASLYVRYIARPEACMELLGGRVPLDRSSLMHWIDGQENQDRRNARVIDKVVVALPIEFTHEQNAELLTSFCERMTEGRAYWAAAMHDGPDDRDNPHAHILFRDRDLETGKRVMLTTEQGSTQRFRDAWEEEVNRALEREGFEERIDKRSLKDQGLEREPQIHVGAAAKRLHDRDYEFRSEEKEITRIIDGVPTKVTVNYPVIDEGKTRFQENEERKARNLEQERAMNGIFAAERELQNLYLKATKTDTIPDDPTDPLATIVAFHMRDMRETERQQEKYELWTWRPLENDIGDPHSLEKTTKRGPTDMIASAGLSLIGKISKSLESVLDGPQRDPEERERDMADKNVTSQQQQMQAHLREKMQRDHEAELAKWRDRELQAYLDQRDKERHMDRGR
jgi:hypothetical protein